MKKFTKCLIYSLSLAMLIGGFTASAKSIIKQHSKNQVGEKLNFGTLVGDYKLDTSVNFGSSVLKVEPSKLQDKEVTVIIELDGNTQMDEYLDNGSKGELLEFTQSNDGIEVNNSLVTAQANLAKKLLDMKLIKKVNFNYTVLMNGFSAQATYKDLEEIRSVKGVKAAYVSSKYAVPNYEVHEIKDEPPGENLEGREYPTDSGLCQNDTEYQGEGQLIAVLDTGVDYNHPAFQKQPSNPKVSKEDIANILDKTNAIDINGGNLSVNDVYKSSKIPFQYDYTDRDANALPLTQDHGTHVSGISLGATIDGTFQGVAPEAQLAFMKVFSDYEANASDDVIVQALEDCALLDVDVINASLGSYCGYAMEAELDEEKGELNKRTNKIYDILYKQGVTVNISAGNDYFQHQGAPDGSNLVGNPESGNVGSPGTHETVMCVASVESKKAPYVEANGNFKMSIVNAFDTNNREYDFIKMVLEKAGITDDTVTEVEYVVVPELGSEGDYNGLDVKGKIAFVKRGTLSFADKIKNAASAGAIGIVIYNNTSGIIRMSCGDNVVIPACSITNAAGMELLKTPNGKLRMSNAFLAEPIMSDFSSLGPGHDLQLKPEITSCGGDVYSAIIGGKYARYSGTSMSCPNLTGISAVLREYVTKNWTKITNKPVEEMTKVAIMNIVNQIEMSTTEICYDEYGNAYTPRKQGAGVASLRNAIDATSYLSMDGTDKVKAELKDDKQKTGTYTIEFNVNNFADTETTYDVKNITQTENTDADGKTTALIGHRLNPTMTVKVNGSTITGTQVKVNAKSSAKVSVTLQLSAEEKAYIDSKFPNGMFVEGYIQLVSSNETLNCPFLAFYGDWSQAPIWDKTYYEIQSEDMYKDGIEEKDRLHADIKEAIPFGHYGEFYIIQLGSYCYEMNDWEHPILSDEEKAAISIFEDNAIYDFYAVQGGLMRNCAEIVMTITDDSTGEIVYQKINYNQKKDAFYSNSGATLSWFVDSSLNPYDLGLANSSKYTVTYTAKISDDYPTNPRDTLNFSFYVDYEAPAVTDVKYTKEKDKKGVTHYYADVTFYDNRYCMSYTPCIITGTEASGYALSMLEDNIPIYQEQAGRNTTVRFDVTDYLTQIGQSSTPDTFYIYVDDYALNSSLYFVSLEGVDFEDLSFVEGSITISENQVVELSDYINNENAMLQGFTWKCNPSSVAKLQDGQLLGLKRGIATVTGTSEYGVTLKQSIKVLGPQDEGYQEFKLPEVESIDFDCYETLFAYTDDIERTKVGQVGIKYYSNVKSLTMFPRESVQYTTSFYPWYHETSNDYSIEWSSSDYSVVDVDDEGVVTAQGAGSAIVTAYVVKNGKTTRTRASINVEVKDGMITQGSFLTGYKGLYEDIFITKESGINYISNHAFSLYNYLINDKTFDYKPIGNNFIKSIYFHPEVEQINKGAMYGLTALEEVTLPRDIVTISDDMFYGDINLKTVEMVEGNHITNIGHNAFYNNRSLTTIDLSNVSNIGDRAFAGCTSLNNIDLSKQQFGGTATFMGCTSLTNVQFSKMTYIGKQMFENTGVTFTELPVEYIGERAFYNNRNLRSIHFTGKNITIGSMAFAYCSNLQSITFDEGATVTIAKNAFAGTNISSLTLNNVDLRLSDQIFSNSAFRTLTVNGTSTITFIDDSPFYNSINFATINGNSTVYNIENNFIYSLDGTELILAAPKANVANLKSTITTIGKGALAGSQATTITLPSTIREINDYAFSNSQITLINFSNAQVKLNANALRNASRLVTLQNLVIETLGTNALTGTRVNSITFTEDVVIAPYAFASMTSLQNVTFQKDAVISAHAFDGAFITNGGTVNFGTNSHVEIGDYAFQGSNIKNIDLTKVSSIGEGAFANAKLLTSINLSNVTSLGAHAFENNEALTSITLPTSLLEIKESTFKGCISLTSIDLKNVETIGDEAFSHTALRSIDLTKVNEIGDYAFELAKLGQLELHDNMTFGQYAFNSNTVLLKVVLPSQMKELPYGIFSACESLSNINLDNIEVVNDFALSNCAGIVNANVSNIKVIGNYGMANVSIQTLNLPNVETIGEFGLYSAKASTISLPKVKSIGQFAFAYSKITTLDLPETLEDIGVGMSYFCSNLNELTVNGKASYKSDKWIVEDGVLYTVLKDGSYMLECYPENKASESFKILDGTSRIQEGAFYNASKIKEVTFPASVKTIGDGAFYNTERLTHYIFLGDAPTLECFYSSELTDYINNLDATQLPSGLQQIYKYSYWVQAYYYSNFNDFVGVNDDQQLSVTYNYENRDGFETLVYKTFFKYKDVLGAPDIPDDPVGPGDTSSDIPSSDNPSNDTPDTPKKGCKGEIGSMVLLVSALTLAGTTLYFKRKD